MRLNMVGTAPAQPLTARKACSPDERSDIRDGATQIAALIRATIHGFLSGLAGVKPLHLH
jgi:hypothetical protein